MTYTVKFTDPQKEAVEVFDNTTNSIDTSLKFSGRNTTNYGTVVAENFLHLLENFAAPTAPTSPIEGQLWYNNDEGTLYVCDDNKTFQPASGVRTGPATPTTGKLGDIWVDTNNQQLYIYAGSTWILVGPLYSTGAKSGPIVETLTDVDNINHSVVTMYAEGIPMSIISNASFNPKPSIAGFPSGVGAGVTISTVVSTTGGTPWVASTPVSLNNIIYTNDSRYYKVTVAGTTGTAKPNHTSGSALNGSATLDALIPKFNGTATSADSLIVGLETVKSSSFLRGDTKSATNYQLSILTSDGLKIGSEGSFGLTVTNLDASISNSSTGGSVNIKNKDSQDNLVSILSVVNQKVGIKNISPEFTLDVNGTLGVTGVISAVDTTAAAGSVATALTGAVKIGGGLAVVKNAIIGTTLKVIGDTTTGVGITSATILPATNEASNLGSSSLRWNTVFVKTINATTITGTFDGNITGTSGNAVALKDPTTFQISGDVITTEGLEFDGAFGGTKTFVTEITSNLISSKASSNASIQEDQFLFYRPGSEEGLYKTTRDTMVGDLAVPIGSILPFAGAVAPVGYLLCDGSQVEKNRFPELFSVIGSTYGAAILGTNFRIPDLRGRFPLGKDNMDNARTVAAPGGGSTDAGGGTAYRVNEDSAITLGGSGGQEQDTLTIDNLPIPSGSNAVTVPYAAGSPSGQLGSSFSVMNPYLTLNYIIRTGKARY